MYFCSGLYWIGSILLVNVVGVVFYCFEIDGDVLRIVIDVKFNVILIFVELVWFWGFFGSECEVWWVSLYLDELDDFMVVC